MKMCFTPKRFGSDAEAMIATIEGILDSYERQGYDLSLRQLYYQLVARDIVPNTERSYKNIGNLVSDARLAGLLDWDMIKDRGREVVQNPHWGDPADFLESVARQYRFDLWHNQPCYVEVMVEKQALEGVLEPVCRKWDVPFTANKGYSSSSALYEAGHRFADAANAGKECHVIYLGDHDPSGIDMSRDVEDRLDLFVKRITGDTPLENEDWKAVEMHRIALNMNQIKKLNPPENPAKITDSRAEGYIKRFGHSSWELDAIEPSALAALVNDAIEELADTEIFDGENAKQNKGRADILKFAETYRKKNK